MKNSVCLKKILVILAFGCSTLFAQRTLYFLPPSDDKWIAGNSYIYNGEKAELMKIDTSRCGWFKVEYSSSSVIPEKVFIYLGPQGIDKIDSNGRGADVNNQAWIPLRAKFGTNTSLYLTADNLPAGYQTTYPNKPDSARCTYKMAAFIYDTDSTVNPSFRGAYCSLDPSGNPRCPGLGTVNQNGLRRGIVMPDLDTATKKPTFNTAKGNGYANWKDKESFDAAFTPKGLYKGKVANIPRCYDMPFGRATNGTWEFDSDKMRTPTGNNLVGGFFPYILDKAYSKDEDGTDRTDDYTKDCPTCNNEYDATCFNPMNTTRLNNVPALNYNTKNYQGLEAFDRANDRLPDGWNNAAPYNVYEAYNVYACGTPAGQPRPGFDGAKKSKANLSFCFESHGEFAYEKGQEFFFRGDDDIWVFINNRLVIDLGGVHSATPGFVDLDTIKTPKALVEGERYPIDIFFCERMGTQSNVRVSTNMYITQKSTFYSNVKRPEQPMCVSAVTAGDCASRMNNPTASKPSKYCGSDLTKNGYTVEFYMIARGSQEKIPLSQIASHCTGKDENNFTCYGGIKVEEGAIYSCGGKGMCKGDEDATKKVVNLPGNDFTIYSRLLYAGKQQGNPISIDNIKIATNPRIVWGSLNSQNNSVTGLTLKDAYGDTTKKEQAIIAGKYTPIYIAGGKWKDTINYTNFTYDNDPESAKVRYSLDGMADLEISLDSLGEKAATFPRELPASGIDTLWVKGDYKLGNREFSINVSGVSDKKETPSLKLTVYQPELRFTKKSYDALINPTSPSIASGFQEWVEAGDATSPPLVGRALDVYLVAWDSRRDKLCSHCTFPLYETSTTNSDAINNLWGDGIVQSDALRIENGKQSIFIRGKDVVDSNNYAKWRIYGPSESFTSAEWDSLQFKFAPVSMPEKSYIYDRNGDGIGDSLIILFGKSFRDKNDAIANEFLPILIEVVWEKGNTKTFYNEGYSIDYTLDNLKKKDYVIKLYKEDVRESFFAANRLYWDKYLIQNKTEEIALFRKLTGDTSEVLPDFGIMVIKSDDMAFSKDILTSGKGSISSYTPYYDLLSCGNVCGDDAFMYRPEGYQASVFDRIPPIVVKAEYTADKKANCMDSNVGCREKIVAHLSEPVFADVGANDVPGLTRNPFSYCFEYSQRSSCTGGNNIERRNQEWNSLGWEWELPQQVDDMDTAHSSTYKPSKKNSPARYYEGSNKGDSIVELIYYARKRLSGGAPDAPTTHMPKATDWVKIRPPSSVNGNYDVFRDAEGNSSNPREIGVLISGTNRYKKDQVKIATINPNATPDDPPLSGTFSEGGKTPAWITEEGRDYADHYLFSSTPDSVSVSEFLPIPKNYHSDSIKTNYPASVGTVFKIAEIIQPEASKVWDACEGKNCKTKDGKPLTKDKIAEGITIHANVYYHTNLGNYTAHRVPIVAKCTDPIFQGNNPDPDRGDNCWGNEYNFYLAWDLKTNKNRFVGAGAYVAITKFYWQMEYIDNEGNLVSQKFNQDEFIDMFGARRSKGK